MPFNFNRHLIFLITSEVEHLFIGWLYFIFSEFHPQPPTPFLPFCCFFYFNLLDTSPLCLCLFWSIFIESRLE